MTDMAPDGSTQVQEEEARRQQLLTALAKPERRVILKELAGLKELSPQERSKRLGARLSNQSYHFRVLAGLEVIAPTRTERVRGSIKHFYRFAITERWALEALGLPPAA